MECILLEEVEVEAKAVALILVGYIWMLHIDRASNARGFEARMILASPDAIIAKQAIHFNFKTSNNKVEYEALLVGLRLPYKLRILHFKALTDFQLVIGQVCEKYEAKDPTMKSTWKR